MKPQKGKNIEAAEQPHSANREQAPDLWGEQLVTKFQPFVMSYAYFLAGSFDLSKRMAKRSFLRAQESLDQFDPQQSLLRWVLKQTTEIFLDLREELGQYMDSQVGPIFFSAMEKNLGILPAQVVPALLFLRTQLTSKEMVVLGLFRLMDIPLAEIANLLRWKYPTVKVYSQRANDALEKWRLV